MGLALSGPSALVICMPRRSSDMKRRVPRLTTDEEAEAFLDSDLSDLDFSQFKPGRLHFEEGSGSPSPVTVRRRAAEIEEPVPSDTYRLFEQAMVERKQIRCMYDGH